MFRFPSLKDGASNRVLTAGLAGIALLGANGAFAQSITISNGSPATKTTGAVMKVSDNFGVSQPAANKAKLSGTGAFTSSGGDGTIIVDVQGTADTQTGNVFSATYDFTLMLTGSGTLSYTLSATAKEFGSTVPLFSDSSKTPLQGPASMEYSGTDTSSVIPISLSNVPFDANLTVSWDGAALGDDLTVEVPDHSIDVALATPAAVPEPSALPLVAMGAPGLLGLLAWRRFAPRKNS